MAYPRRGAREVPRAAAWRRDRVYVVLWAASYAFLTGTVIVLVEFAQGIDFWAWVAMAGALAIVWVASVATIGRSGDTPTAERAP